MAVLKSDREKFCELEADSFPDSEFGATEDGLIVHITSAPTGSVPGRGHTLTGWQVQFEGRHDAGEWRLSHVTQVGT